MEIVLHFCYIKVGVIKPFIGKCNTVTHVTQKNASRIEKFFYTEPKGCYSHKKSLCTFFFLYRAIKNCATCATKFFVIEEIAI